MRVAQLWLKIVGPEHLSRSSGPVLWELCDNSKPSRRYPIVRNRPTRSTRKPVKAGSRD